MIRTEPHLIIEEDGLAWFEVFLGTNKEVRIKFQPRFSEKILVLTQDQLAELISVLTMLTMLEDE